jgi:glutamyl-tRNA reductase
MKGRTVAAVISGLALQLTNGLQLPHVVPTPHCATSPLAASRATVLCQAVETPSTANAAVQAAAAEGAQAAASQQPKKEKKNKEKKERKRGGPAGVPFVIGLSHKTAKVEVREKLSIPEASWNTASAALCEYETVQEAAILSTCNRFEIYLVAEDPYKATTDVLEYLRGHSGLEDAELRPSLFMLHGNDAIWHLLRVSAGLDSLVVGEGQILSQVKACYSHAIEPADEEQGVLAGSAGKVLGRLLNTAVMSGKFVRSETEIAKGAVSISSAAVELAIQKAPLDLGALLSEVRITIVGAGKMSKLLLTHLASHGVTKCVLLNRSRPGAEELAAQYPDMDIEVLLMDDFWSVMERSDLVFTSTSSTSCIVTRDNLSEHAWGAEDAPKLSLIDISVPRNVETECNDLPNVVAYNVDDLKEVVAANQARRAHKVLEAEVLLRKDLEKFVSWQESLAYVPTISTLQQKYEATRSAELQKALGKSLKNLSDKEKQAVDVLTKGILNKLIHAPMSYLRSDAEDGDKATVAQIKQMFQLDR